MPLTRGDWACIHAIAWICFVFGFTNIGYAIYSYCKGESFSSGFGAFIRMCMMGIALAAWWHWK